MLCFVITFYSEMSTAVDPGVPTPSTPVDRQDPLPIFRCPGNAFMLRWVFPDHPDHPEMSGTLSFCEILKRGSFFESFWYREFRTLDITLSKFEESA